MLPLWREGDIILRLYEVRGVVGSGNFGTVYRVYHLGWRKELAVKSPNEETLANRQYLDVCLRGAQTWADLGIHPNLASCFYIHEIDGIPRICMEYVAGESLEKKLTEGIDLQQALDYAIQICAGMAHAHRYGVIHGDLKPGNCLVAPDGMLKVSDFGLGTVEEFAGDVESWMRALDYVAPERWHLGAEVTPAADIFSFGVILCRMVRGDRPVWQEDEALAANRTCDELSDASIPAGLSSLINECLRENPVERPDGFGGLGKRLHEIYREVTGSSYICGNIGEHGLRVAGLNKRGASLHNVGMKDEALRALEDAVRADPSHLDSSYNHSLLLWDSGKMTDREVIRWLEMKAESHAGEWRPLYLLGLANIARKDVAAAESALQEALKIVTDGKAKAALEEVERAGDSWPHILLTLSGHEHTVNSVAISPDSRFAVSGSEDKNLRYWDLLAGLCIRVLKGHERAVKVVAMSSDGRFALSGGDDKVLRYWDLRTGECLRVLSGHERPVNSVAVSADGGFALSGSDDKTLHYWDLGTGECLRVLKGHERAVNSVVISADGRFALSGSDDRNLRHWNLGTGECLRTLAGHERIVNSVAVTADGAFALSGSDDRSLRYWDLSTGECLRVLTGHEDVVSCIAIASGDRFAFSQGRDKTMRLWDLTTGACLRTIDRHDRGSSAAAVSPDARFVLSGSDDKDLILWYLGGIESLRLPFVVEQAEKDEVPGAHASDFSVLKERVAECMDQKNWRGAAEYLHRVRAFPGYERHPEVMNLWHEIGTKGVRKAFNECWIKGVLKGHEDWVNSAAISPDGRFALSGSDDKTVRLWDLITMENLCVFAGHRESVSSIAISPDGKLALSGSHDGDLRLWGLRTGESLGTIGRHDKWVSSVAFSPDGVFAVSGSDDRSIRLWETKTGDSLRTIEGLESEVRAIAVSPDGRFVISGSDDNIIRLWDLSTTWCLHKFEGHDSWVSSVAISPDSRYMLSGSLDNTLRLWDLRTGSCLRTLKGHEDWIRCVAISPDGRFALSGSHDRNLRLWDLRTGECLHILKGHDDWVSTVAFSPDGRYALSGSHDSTLCIWEFDWAYDFPAEVDWGEGAAPYLETFVTLHTPGGRDNVARQGKAAWNERDFTRLLHELSLRGYGWLRPDGVVRKLEALAGARDDNGSEPSMMSVLPKSGLDEVDNGAVVHCVCCGHMFPASLLSMAGFCADCRSYVSRQPDTEDQGSWWKRLTGRQQA